MKDAASPPKTGVSCSACGAMVVVSPTLRGTKMQCPKCRAVIALPDPGKSRPIPETSPEGEVAGKASPERPETTRLEARLSTVEVRVALLEQELISLKLARRVPLEPPTPMAQADLANGNHRELVSRTAKAGEKRIPEIAETQRNAGAIRAAAESPHERGAQEFAPPLKSERPDATPEERMAQKLMEIADGKVAIRVKEGDAAAFEFGERLRRVFMAAGWTVTTLEACPLPPEKQNLTMALSGDFPFPKTASAIHRAFAAAGMGLVFEIDPTCDSPIPTLIVPQRPPEDS